MIKIVKYNKDSKVNGKYVIFGIQDVIHPNPVKDYRGIVK